MSASVPGYVIYIAKIKKLNTFINTCNKKAVKWEDSQLVSELSLFGRIIVMTLLSTHAIRRQ